MPHHSPPRKQHQERHVLPTKPRIPAELLASDLGTAVPTAELEILDRLATTIRVAEGDQIVQKNGFGRECFVVIDGQFKVERDDVTILLGAGSRHR